MTAISHTDLAGFQHRLRAFGRYLRLQHAAWQARRRVIQELNTLDTRELNDMGISPRDFGRIADSEAEKELQRGVAR